LSPGELACTLGHLTIYERILSEDVSQAFVFEDDVILNNFGQEIHQVINFMNVTSSRFVHLGGQEGTAFRFKIRGHRHEVFDRFFSVPNIYFTFLIRTCGYAISQEFASKLVHVLRECPFRIDDFNSVARAFSVQSLDFFDTISHPRDNKLSLIESERTLISSPDSNGVRLFQRVFNEFRRTYRFRAAGIMRRYSEWRRPTVALFFEGRD
jgi:GR25 family glycosyltransferase involved in LPS biosynthesis